MFFTKPTYVEMQLPFRFIEIPADSECGIINIEAYGSICGKNKYCYAYYELKGSKMYRNGDFEHMVEMLKNSVDKTVKVIIKVIIKVKKGLPKNFKIDVNSLAEVYNDERFKSLSLLGWGLNDKSYKEISTKR